MLRLKYIYSNCQARVAKLVCLRYIGLLAVVAPKCRDELEACADREDKTQQPQSLCPKAKGPIEECSVRTGRHKHQIGIEASIGFNHFCFCKYPLV